MKRNKEERKGKLFLTLLFSFMVFIILVLSVVLAGVAVYILANFDVFTASMNTYPSIGLVILFMALISILLGSGFAVLLSRLSLSPITKVVTQMNRLASGDFKARLNFSKRVSRLPVFSDITNGFNKMAQELENTEMLRGDFINNFSHEFKTPIVSIAGFAKLLKRDNIPQETKDEYVNIIEEESLRLSYMATNVLNLTKVENQTILTDTAVFNLSEQLRSCLLILENKWAKKNIDFDLDFTEHSITANEELLKQVWINLIDNAIKFSPENELVTVTIRDCGEGLKISVSNKGPEISEADKIKIFRKFYQADISHSSEGNGVGLAIVKRIVELHKGGIEVESKGGITTFTVIIPKKPLNIVAM